VSPSHPPVAGVSRAATRFLQWGAAAVAILGSCLALAACGGPTTLGVSLGLDRGQSADVAPGETVRFVVTATDTGPSGSPASGVTVSVALPAGFRYDSTTSLDEGSGVRTKPVDAQGGSNQPVWGVWELGGHGDSVRIVFEAIAGGQPGPATLTASASGSNTGTTQSEGLVLQVLAAPQLSASVSVTPNQAQPGQDVTYSLSVLNQGTGQASGVDILVTLPPVFAYDGGEQILGNASRSGGTDPVMGTLLPYFDGFDIPPHSGSSPGQLVLRFRAKVLSGAGALGSYPVGVQILANSGQYRVTLPITAPVQVS
jgi:uncharacterized repeat protein (TIGR01451 family)